MFAVSRSRVWLLVTAALAIGATDAGSQGGWQRGAPLPVPRSEVAATALGDEIAVIGGFLRSGASSTRVDAYSPRRNRWRRLPDLPEGVNHAMAAATGRRLYVVGGYRDGMKLTSAFVLEGGTWRALPELPEPRAAAGAAVVGGLLIVAGGVGPNGLAQEALALGLQTERWSHIPGPTPREHLGVAALDGRVYAVGGRTAGFDTNLQLVESYSPGARRWRSLPPVPEPRGGTAVASAGGRLISAGGEETAGTIGSVYALGPKTRRWSGLPDLPTPRHGLGVVGLGGRVYVIAGGRTPGLSVSSANESLAVAQG
jgi:hypothetical protein